MNSYSFHDNDDDDRNKDHTDRYILVDDDGGTLFFNIYFGLFQAKKVIRLPVAKNINFSFSLQNKTKILFNFCIERFISMTKKAFKDSFFNCRHRKTIYFLIDF